jgi:hypothetical protein
MIVQFFSHSTICNLITLLRVRACANDTVLFFYVQCEESTAPLPFDDDRVSMGSIAAQPAVMRKQAEERKRGVETLMLRRRPVRMGAMMPASRLRAEAMPHAVPLCFEKVSHRWVNEEATQRTHRVETGKASGVYP